MKTKKLVLLATLLVSLALPSLSSCGTTDLVFFNWGEYIDTDLIQEFEEKENVNIKLLTFDTNESMIEKLESSTYDLVVPSDYAIEELASQDKLLPLDMTKFSTYSQDRLVPSLKSALDNLAAPTQDGDDGFDLLKYAVPYTWGEVGLIYDSSAISSEEIATEGWNALRTAKNKDGSDRKVCVYDAARDAYSIALSACGHNFVNPSDEELNDATDWLLNMSNNLGDNLSFKTDEILDEMPEHKYDICLDYSGDAIYSIMNEADPVSPLKFYIPEAQEGSDTRTNIYTDALCITKECQNVDLAYKFIDFLCTKEAATANTEWIGYTTPLDDVYESVTSEGGAYEDVADVYKVNATDKDHFYRYNAALKAKITDLWNANIR
ncbi:MAG: extracellular solute-binding protein [Bacilli bacterium]|nr:extracellular solute-binding protein [Bacilli bacterium]